MGCLEEFEFRSRLCKINITFTEGLIKILLFLFKLTCLKSIFSYLESKVSDSMRFDILRAFVMENNLEQISKNAFGKQLKEVLEFRFLQDIKSQKIVEVLFYFVFFSAKVSP